MTTAKATELPKTTIIAIVTITETMITSPWFRLTTMTDNENTTTNANHGYRADWRFEKKTDSCE